MSIGVIVEVEFKPGSGGTVWRIENKGTRLQGVARDVMPPTIQRSGHEMTVTAILGAASRARSCGHLPNGGPRHTSGSGPPAGPADG